MKKIMFNDLYGLTTAVLELRKTQTRRLITKALLEKACKFKEEYYEGTFDILEGKELLEHYFLSEHPEMPPYKVGEEVAVARCYAAEGWGDSIPITGLDNEGMPTFASEAGVFNKMFVRSDLMRYRIKITGIRVERLQDISEGDCLAEGVKETLNGYYVIGLKAKGLVKEAHYDDGDGVPFKLFPTAREAYAALIDKVSGKGTWDGNPYVFVYDFKLIDTNEGKGKKYW